MDLHNLARVLNDLGDVCTVTRADFTQDTFVDEDNTSNEPVAPKDTDGVEVAVRRTVGFDHAEHAVELPVDEEHNEQVVRVPAIKGVNKGEEQRSSCNTYQNRSKLARLRFSIAYQTMIPSAAVMIHPVIPGPVAKLACKNKTKRGPICLV